LQIDDLCLIDSQMEIETDFCKIYIATASSTESLDMRHGMVRLPARGCGISTSAEIARLKASAECLESIHYLQPPRYPAASQSLLGEVLIPVGTGTSECTLESVATWPAVQLHDGKTVQLPRQLIFAHGNENEPKIVVESNSSGVGCGPVAKGYAVRSGFLELVERDGIFGAWLAGKKLAEIKIRAPEARDRLGGAQDGTTPLNEGESDFTTLLNGVKSLGLDVLCLDATTDLDIPTVLCICSKGGRQITVGSSAAHSFQLALSKALLEAMQTRPFLAPYSDEEIVSRIGEKPHDRFDAIDRALYWWAEGRMDRLTDHIVDRSSFKTIQVNAKVEEAPAMATYCAKLHSKGYKVIVADISSCDLHQAGWEVVRVIVPDLLAAFTRERSKPLHHRRWGHFPASPSFPHPFA
jgi:thiazole/oxazole-forming peptide maturase SagD family component